MRGLVRPCRFHRYHRHKGRHLIGRQRELAILGRSDPVRQMLRSEIMLPRHIRYHRARCDRLGNNPPLLLIAPPSAADNARYFRVAPNNLRVVTNVDHNVHTILDPKNRDRAPLAVTQLCGVKAPLTLKMPTGTVKWFNTAKGYGFIMPQGGGKDVFVHISAVERAGLSSLNEGQAVEFELVSSKGKTSAENLRVRR